MAKITGRPRKDSPPLPPITALTTRIEAQKKEILAEIVKNLGFSYSTNKGVVKPQWRDFLEALADGTITVRKKKEPSKRRGEVDDKNNS